jgi:MFS family permease
MTESNSLRVYGYRWIVLVAFIFIAAMTQVLWITFAPVTILAVAFYHVSDLMIALLSMSFMIVYILLVIPAAWVIDTWGFRTAVGIGAALTGVFGLTRGLFGNNFGIVFASQIGIAIGQPFVIGAITKLVACWFPREERGTATGLGTLALYLGPLLAMLLTPALAAAYQFRGMLLIYGVAAMAAAAVFLIFARARPPTPVCPPDQEVRALMFDGLKTMLRQRDFVLLLVIFFIGLGMFNALSTWIEDIIRPRGFLPGQAGTLGGLMLIAGIAGAATLPMLSDRVRRRKPFVLLALAGLVPGLVGLTFASSYWLLLVSGAVFGFFLLSAGPIGFQYGAEMTYPAPEGTSNSLLLVAGQVSGIAFIFGMNALKAGSTGSMTLSLLCLVGLTGLSIVLAALLRESPIHSETAGKT